MTNDELYNLVPIGKENAVPMEYLVSASGMNERRIRSIFYGPLLMERKIVASLQCGYFRPATKKEMGEYERFRYAYVKGNLRRHKIIRKAYDDFDNIYMFGVPNYQPKRRNAADKG
jgi:hypothetical protein